MNKTQYEEAHSAAVAYLSKVADQWDAYMAAGIARDHGNKCEYGEIPLVNDVVDKILGFFLLNIQPPLEERTTGKLPLLRCEVCGQILPPPVPSEDLPEVKF